MNKNKVWKIIKTILKIALIFCILSLTIALLRSCADHKIEIPLPWGDQGDKPNDKPVEGGDVEDVEDDTKLRHVVEFEYTPTRIDTAYVLNGVPLSDVLPEDPTLANAVFKGWRLNDEPIDESMKVTSSLHLVAQWQSAYYEVAFYNADVRVSVFNVANGSTIGSRMPQDPVKETFIFDGWYSNNEEITANTIVSRPIRATARWKACDEHDLELVETREDRFGHEQAEYRCTKCNAQIVYTVHIFVPDSSLADGHDEEGHVISHWICRLCDETASLVGHDYVDGVCTICGQEEQPPHEYASIFEDVSSGDNTGGDQGGNQGGSSGDNTGGDQGGNQGGNQGGDQDVSSGDNTGGDQGGNQGGNQGSATETFTPTKDDAYFYFENDFVKKYDFGWETHGGDVMPRYKVIAPETVLVTYIPSEFIMDYKIVIVADDATFDEIENKISCNTTHGASSVSFSFTSADFTFSDLDSYFLNGASGAFEYSIIDHTVQGNLYLDSDFWNGQKSVAIRIFRGIPHFRDYHMSVVGDDTQLLSAFVRGPNNNGEYVGHFVTAAGYYVEKVVLANGNVIENTDKCNEFNFIVSSAREDALGMTVYIEELDTTEFDAKIDITCESGRQLIRDVDYAIRYYMQGNDLVITIKFFTLEGESIEFEHSFCELLGISQINQANRAWITFQTTQDTDFSISINLK